MSLATLITVLNGLKPLASAIPSVGKTIGIVIDLSITVCERIQLVEDNKAQLLALGQKQAEFTASIAAACTKSEKRDLWASRLAPLTEALSNITLFMDKRFPISPPTGKAKKLLEVARQALNAGDIRDEISDLEKELAEAIKYSQLNMVTDGLQLLEVLEETIRPALRDIYSRQAEMRDSANKRMVNERLQPVLAAQFDSALPPPCTEGTRVDLLDHLHSLLTKHLDVNVVWISGRAGTGKTTVARSMCDILVKDGVDVVSFFIRRDIADRCRSRTILHSLVYQLALSFPEVHRAVEDTDAKTFHLPIHSQVETLIKVPLATSTSLGPSCIIVLDALDECESSQWKDCDLLQCLIAAMPRGPLAPVRLLVTTRDTPTTVSASPHHDSPPLVHHVHWLDSTYYGEKDIATYISASFAGIRDYLSEKHGAEIPENWPSKQDVKHLAERSSGLFAYAATVVRMVFDVDAMETPENDPADPVDLKLAHILHEPSSVYSATPSYSSLYTLYSRVLKNALRLPHDADDAAVRKAKGFDALHSFLGALIVLASPLEVATLKQLLATGAHSAPLHGQTVDVYVRALSPVLHVVPHDNVVEFFHSSFREFLTCVVSCFYIDEHEMHAVMALRCLTVIMNYAPTQLIFDVSRGEFTALDFDNSFMSRREVDYSRSLWKTHINTSMATGKGNPQIMTALETLLQRAVCQWLDTTEKRFFTHDSYLDEVALYIDRSGILIFSAEAKNARALFSAMNGEVRNSECPADQRSFMGILYTAYAQAYHVLTVYRFIAGTLHLLDRRPLAMLDAFVFLSAAPGGDNPVGNYAQILLASIDGHPENSSLPELSASASSAGHLWSVMSPDKHTLATQACLSIIIINLRAFSLMFQDDEIEREIYPELLYAVRRWTKHLQGMSALALPAILPHLCLFITTTLSDWIHIMNTLNRGEELQDAMRIAHTVCRDNLDCVRNAIPERFTEVCTADKIVDSFCETAVPSRPA